MGTRIHFPRLNKRLCERLFAAHQHCVTVDGVLRRTQWTGAPSCIALVGEIDQVITELYNLAERAFAPEAAAAAATSPDDARAELAHDEYVADIERIEREEKEE